MGHLFEKGKICHGYQGNYHSERKWGGRVGGCSKKGKRLTAFMGRIILWDSYLCKTNSGVPAVLLFLSHVHLLLCPHNISVMVDIQARAGQIWVDSSVIFSSSCSTITPVKSLLGLQDPPHPHPEVSNG